MRHAKRIAAVLVLMLVVSSCQKEKSVAPPHQVLITSSDSTCKATRDPVVVQHGHKIKWDLGPGTSGDFEVNFKQENPCDEEPPWKARGSKACSIGSKAGHYKTYQYNITKNGTICADPSVQVDD